MPSISESTESQQYMMALKAGKVVPWEEIVRLENIIGGEIRFRGRPRCVRQGIISAITLEDRRLSISCPWLLETPLDEEGDPIGDYMREQWKVIDEPREFKLSVSKNPPTEKDTKMIHSTLGSFATGEWAVRYSDHVIGFCAGTAHFYLRSFPTSQFYASARELAPNFGLRAE